MGWLSKAWKKSRKLAKKTGLGYVDALAAFEDHWFERAGQAIKRGFDRGSDGTDPEKA